MSRLVLLRHGESTANAEDRFAGWLDVPLTPRGLVRALGGVTNGGGLWRLAGVFGGCPADQGARR